MKKMYPAAFLFANATRLKRSFCCLEGRRKKSLKIYTGCGRIFDVLEDRIGRRQ